MARSIRETKPPLPAGKLADSEEKTEIVAKLKEFKRRRELAAAELSEVVGVLKAERSLQGMSLADVEQRTGMSRAAICRLENMEEAHPTIATLTRIADALGKRLVIALEDKS